MNNQLNSHLKASQQVGNNVDFFTKWKSIIKLNDGKRHCGTKVENSTDKQTPFPFTDKTHIRLTTDNYIITNLRKTFMTVRAKYRFSVQCEGGFGDFSADTPHSAKLFIGYKSSNQAIREMEIFKGGVSADYHSKYCVQEGFAYSTLRPLQSRKNKPYMHSLYEDVFNYSNNICGTYVNLADVADGLEHEVEFEFNIYVNDLLALQCFDKWHKDYGALILELYLAHNSLVVALCAPDEVLYKKKLLEGDSSAIEKFGGAYNSVSRRFTQVRDWFDGWNGCAINGTDATQLDFTPARLRVDVSDAWAQDFQATIRGYDITDTASRQILNLTINEPFIIPSQELYWSAFSQQPTAGGIINANMNIPFSNTTAVAVVFPKTSNSLTVYENPMLGGLQLTINGETYPNVHYSTTGARYLQEQLIIADLDGNNTATNELIDSIRNSKNKITGERYINGLSDDTSFVALFQTERGESDYVFDGLDSKGTNWGLRLDGSPLYTGDNDTYYHPRLGEINNNCAQVWLCNDSFFVVSQKHFKYIKNYAPRESQSENQ